MTLQRQVSLLPLTTFHLAAVANELIQVNTLAELLEVRNDSVDHAVDCLFLGGGSNVLITAPIKQRVIRNSLKGIEIVHETEDHIDIAFASGENWHECVMWCVDRGYGGIENLALIPGTIGAAPMQNIGAYGADISQVLLFVDTLEWATGEARRFSAEACALGYRDSYFKHEGKNKFFITRVALRLSKKPKYCIDYGDVQQVLREQFNNEINLHTIAQSIMHIRQSKLPNPDELGNAGSFFKNPVIPALEAEKLKQTYPNMPQYPNNDGVKIPAAWLIEHGGPEAGVSWKGYRRGACGVHQKQALVLVNYGGAQGEDILRLSSDIMADVQARFGIALEREVNIW
ncbi:MAG: UDP-N-acetylmuramate dehydrogenase [Chitinophagaceae bacterium]